MDLDEAQIPGAYPNNLPPIQPPPAITTDQLEPVVLPRRARRRPVHFQDILPETPVPTPPKQQLPMVYLMVTNPLMTIRNTLGVFQKYLFHPSYDPDSVVDPGELSNLGLGASPIEPKSTEHGPPWPFSNMSVWRLAKWMNTGSRSKSEGEVNWLVNDVLKSPNFSIEDIQGFNAHQANGHLNASKKKNPLDNNFQVASVTIEVPTGERTDSGEYRLFSVPGLHYRNLLSIIEAMFQSPLSRNFHFTPSFLMHRSPVTGTD